MAAQRTHYTNGLEKISLCITFFLVKNFDVHTKLYLSQFFSWMIGGVINGLVCPKFPHVPLEVGGWPLHYEEQRCWANCPCN